MKEGHTLEINGIVFFIEKVNTTTHGFLTYMITFSRKSTAAIGYFYLIRNLFGEYYLSTSKALDTEIAACKNEIISFLNKLQVSL